MLRLPAQRIWVVRTAIATVAFAVAWTALTFVPLAWIDLDYVRDGIEQDWPIVKVLTKEVREAIALDYWQPMLALVLAAVTLRFSKGPAELVVTKWWPAPAEFLGLPAKPDDALRFESRATGLTGRGEELAQLREFAFSEPVFTWCWLLGSAGSGKSRLALEWLYELDGLRSRWRRPQFDVAFLMRPGSDRERWRTWTPRRRTAIVIDDSADDPDAVRSMLTSLGERSQTFEHPVRVLLLERSRPERLRELDEGAAFVRYRTDQSPVTLTPLGDAQMWEMLETLDRERGALASDNKDLRAALLRLSEGMPLFAIMGYESLREGSADTVSLPEDLLADQVRRLNHKLDGHGVTLEGKTVIALATLCRGLSWRTAAPFGVSEAHKTVLDAALSENTAERIPPLAPAVLGEAYLLDRYDNLIEFQRDPFLKAAWSSAPERVARTLWDLHLDFPRDQRIESLDRVPETSPAILWWGRVRAVLLAFIDRDDDRFEDYWQSLCDLASNSSANDDAALAFAEGAVSAINGFRLKEQWESMEAAYSGLREIAKRFKTNPAFQLALAQGAIATVDGYGVQKKWVSMQNTYRDLSRVARRFDAEPPIQFSLAQGAYNAVANCGAHQRWSCMDAAYGDLSTLANRFKSEPAFQLEAAEGAVNVVRYCGEHQRWVAMEAAYSDLQRVALPFETDPAFQTALARGAVHAVSGYGAQQRWKAMRGTYLELRRVAGRFSEDRAIQHELVKGLVNAAYWLGARQRLDCMEAADEKLRRVTRRFDADSEFQFSLAHNAVNTILHYGADKRWEAMELAFGELRWVAERFDTDPAIQRALAQGAVNAVYAYGAHQRWDDMNAAYDELCEVARRVETDPAIQLELAKGAGNAIHVCGPYHRWDDMRTAYVELRRVASELPCNIAIQEVYVRVLYNLIVICPPWTRRSVVHVEIARLAKQFPQNSAIQEASSRAGVYM